MSDEGFADFTYEDAMADLQAVVRESLACGEVAVDAEGRTYADMSRLRHLLDQEAGLLRCYISSARHGHEASWFTIRSGVDG